MDHALNKDFIYTHKNPYHDRLEEFSHFVLRDKEGEDSAGFWNQNVFKKSGELFLEIGTGFGEFMLEFCEKNPSVNFVGLDHRFKRSFQVAKKLDRHPYKNFRYLRAKGERVGFLFGENELDGIFYFFPDPWPKNRHHKKRLFQKPFLDAAYSVLKPGGKIFIKTDHDDLAQWMLDRIDDRFETTFKTFDLWDLSGHHFLKEFKTKFETIFIGQGIKIKALELKSLKRM
jgi:tRNA (guanine-N7-)-methyltransferase